MYFFPCSGNREVAAATRRKAKTRRRNLAATSPLYRSKYSNISMRKEKEMMKEILRFFTIFYVINMISFFFWSCFFFFFFCLWNFFLSCFFFVIKKLSVLFCSSFTLLGVAVIDLTQWNFYVPCISARRVLFS